jgi:rRNA biogenesis protein RRP5
LRSRSETSISNPSEAFPIGKIVKVRIIGVEAEQSRIIASIRQASPNFASPVMDISGIEVGDTVQGEIAEIHKENVILRLQPTQARALLSSKNLANYRNIPLAQLQLGLKVGEKLDGLIVVSRVPDKNFVIVANKPQAKSAFPSKNSLTIESATVGQTVLGRVTHHSPHGTLLKINSHLGGLLHPTDTSDDYDVAKAFPPIDSIIKATIIDVRADKKQLVLSMRSSRMQPNKVSDIVDREIKGLEDLQIGAAVRGFIKSVTEHGLFVAIARGVDARVQIKELFDEVRHLTRFFIIN